MCSPVEDIQGWVDSNASDIEQRDGKALRALSLPSEDLTGLPTSVRNALASIERSVHSADDAFYRGDFAVARSDVTAVTHGSDVQAVDRWYDHTCGSQLPATW